MIWVILGAAVYVVVYPAAAVLLFAVISQAEDGEAGDG